MTYLINASGGAGSTLAGIRCMDRFGKDACDWVFADTKSEHPDLYNLLDAVEQKYGIGIKRLSDGRDVWDVFFQSRCIKVRNGGCKAAVELKHKPLDAYRDAHYTPDTCVVVVGMSWMEPERIARIERRQAPFKCLFPLTWDKRLSKCEEIAELEALGLPTPSLYTRGHQHNNCAGACVLAGHAQWVGLLQDDPERFHRYAQKEAEWRKATDNDGTNGRDFSILHDRREGGPRRSMTLLELQARYDAGESFREWRSTCNCMGYEQQSLFDEDTADSFAISDTEDHP